MRRIAAISDVLREEKEAEVEDAIAGKQMTESRSRKRESRRGKGLWCLYLRGGGFCTNAEAQTAGFDGHVG